MTVSELGRRMSALEFVEWTEYAALYPEDKSWWQPMHGQKRQQSQAEIKAAFMAMIENDKHGSNRNQPERQPQAS